MAEFVISTERLEQLVASKVEEATRDLQDRLAKTEKNRDSILREKRDLQLRLRGEEPEHDAQPRIVIPRGVSPKEYLRLKTEAEELRLPYRVEYTPRENLANPDSDPSQNEGEDR